jgi:hypothetical protein
VLFELSRLASLAEVNCQEAFLASCTMAPFTRGESGLGHRGDGPGPGAKVAQLFGCKALHDFLHDMNRGRAKPIHSSKLSAHRAATDVVKRPVRCVSHVEASVGGLHKRSMISISCFVSPFPWCRAGRAEFLSLKISSVRSTMPGRCWQGLTRSHKVSPSRPRPQFPHSAPEMMRSRTATSDWSGCATTLILAKAAWSRTTAVIIQSEH